MQTRMIGDIAVVRCDAPLLVDVQSALDVMAQVSYEYGASKIIIDKTALSEDFFRLSTGLAGEITQKFVNYGCRLAIVGDFSAYASKPLRDYMYECNQGRHINFVQDEQEAVGRLCGKLEEYDTFYHGTKADLRIGDTLTAGFHSNFGRGEQANFVYFTATMDAAIWGAELAQGEGQGSIYIVEPTGAFEDDPNVTDKKYPGNPTQSYRTKEPLRITGRVERWKGHPPQVLQAMLDGIARARELGIEAINE